MGWVTAWNVAFLTWMWTMSLIFTLHVICCYPQFPRTTTIQSGNHQDLFFHEDDDASYCQIIDPSSLTISETERWLFSKTMEFLAYSPIIKWQNCIHLSSRLLRRKLWRTSAAARDQIATTRTTITSRWKLRNWTISLLRRIRVSSTCFSFKSSYLIISGPL